MTMGRKERMKVKLGQWLQDVLNLSHSEKFFCFGWPHGYHLEEEVQLPPLILLLRRQHTHNCVNGEDSLSVSAIWMQRC